MADKLIELWKDSTIIQGTIALATVGVVLYLSIAGKPVPDFLYGLIGTIVGYYFGSKSNQQTRNLMRDIRDKDK